MRYLLCFALLTITLSDSFGADKPLSAKTRAEMDRLDARISKLKFELRENGPKLADYTNKVLTLREQVNEAKNPANVARLQKALAKMEERQTFYETLIQNERAEIVDLVTKRRLLSGAYTGENIAQRNANLGVDDGSAARAARKEEEQRERAKQSQWADYTEEEEYEYGVGNLIIDGGKIAVEEIDKTIHKKRK